MLLRWAELGKSLICLSGDGWGWVPSLLVVWPESTQHWRLLGSSVGLMADLGGLTPRSTSQNFCCQCPCPHGESQPHSASAGDPPTLAGRSDSVSYGVTAPSPGSRCAHYFVCALQEWNLCFPQSYRSPAIKSCLPSKSDSLGIPPHIAGPPGWEA